MDFPRRTLSQESNAGIYLYVQCSEVTKTPETAYDVIMPYPCWSYYFFFFGGGVKNQARKLKFGRPDVLIQLFNMFFGEKMNFLDFMIICPKTAVFSNSNGEKRICRKIRDNHFKDRVKLHFLVSLICILLQI